MQETKSILFTAEDYGFGPTSAIVSFLPYIYKLGIFKEYGFVGCNHALDLHESSPNLKIYECKTSETEKLASIVEKYDVIFTSMEPLITRIALSQKKIIIYYDAVPFSTHCEGWTDITNVISHPKGFNIAQDFFGVREKLVEFSSPPNVCVIPPIVKKRQSKIRDSNFVLMSLGGLQCYITSLDVYAKYAKTVCQLVRKLLPDEVVLKVGTSKKIVEAIDLPYVKTYTPEEIQEMILSCKFAISNPGLANIFEAGSTNTPVIFLPPINLSQGQQLASLIKNGYVDAHCDWSIFASPMDYESRSIAEEKANMDAIAEVIQNLGGETLEKLENLMRENIQIVSTLESSSGAKLIELLGDNGAEKCAEQLGIWMGSIETNTKE